MRWSWRFPGCAVVTDVSGRERGLSERRRRTAELIPNQLNSQRFPRYTLSLILDTVTDTDEDRDIH